MLYKAISLLFLLGLTRLINLPSVDLFFSCHDLGETYSFTVVPSLHFNNSSLECLFSLLNV